MKEAAVAAFSSSMLRPSSFLPKLHPPACGVRLDNELRVMGPDRFELWSGMSSVSLPVTRPAGRALVVGHPGGRARPLDMLRQLGFTCAEADDPYAAMAELCRDPSGYKALILSLAGVYAEELELIGVIKRRHPEMEIWLTDADGRQAALGDALRL